MPTETTRGVGSTAAGADMAAPLFRPQAYTIKAEFAITYNNVTYVH